MKGIKSEAPHGGHGASGSGGPCDGEVNPSAPETYIGQNVSAVDPLISVTPRDQRDRRRMGTVAMPCGNRAPSDG